MNVIKVFFDVFRKGKVQHFVNFGIHLFSKWIPFYYQCQLSLDAGGRDSSCSANQMVVNITHKM